MYYDTIKNYCKDALRITIMEVFKDNKSGKWTGVDLSQLGGGADDDCIVC